MSEENDHVRRSIKVWMRRVMQEKQWSANEWAVKAGTSPTNITRFLSPDSSIVPSAATLAKLSQVAGSEPKLGYNVTQSTVLPSNVRLVPLNAMRESDPKHLWGRLMHGDLPGEDVAVDGPLSGPAFVMDVPNANMAGRGIFPADRLLIEKAATLEAGCTVVFRHEGEVGIGEYQGLMIVFHALQGQVNPPPLRTSSVEVYGRATQLLRKL